MSPLCPLNTPYLFTQSFSPFSSFCMLLIECQTLFPTFVKFWENFVLSYSSVNVIFYMKWAAKVAFEWFQFLDFWVLINIDAGLSMSPVSQYFILKQQWLPLANKATQDYGVSIYYNVWICGVWYSDGYCSTLCSWIGLLKWSRWDFKWVTLTVTNVQNKN